MAYPQNECPNCRSALPLAEMASASSLRCSSCRVYLRVRHPYAFLFRLGALLLSAILLLALRLDWFIASIAFIPTFLLLLCLTSFIRLMVAPPELEVAESDLQPNQRRFT